jgi:hypothetical protein
MVDGSARIDCVGEVQEWCEGPGRKTCVDVWKRGQVKKVGDEHGGQAIVSLKMCQKSTYFESQEISVWSLGRNCWIKMCNVHDEFVSYYGLCCSILVLFVRYLKEKSHVYGNVLPVHYISNALTSGKALMLANSSLMSNSPHLMPNAMMVANALKSAKMTWSHSEILVDNLLFDDSLVGDDIDTRGALSIAMVLVHASHQKLWWEPIPSSFVNFMDDHSIPWHRIPGRPLENGPPSTFSVGRDHERIMGGEIGKRSHQTMCFLHIFVWLWPNDTLEALTSQ